jgi:predicted amidohydrolase YtcJ
MNAARWKSATIAALLSVAATGNVSASDLLLLHGHIYTGVPQTPWVEALAVTGTRIDATGTDQELLTRRRAKTRVIDLHGLTVIPGIVDSHMHMLYGAMALHGFNLSTPEASITPDQPQLLVARIKEYAASHPSDRILLGRADFSAAPPYAPGHELLDQAVQDRPLIVHNTSEHALWLNAKALALAGITDQPVADPVEERNVIRDASGHPSGVLIEAAMQLMERVLLETLTVDEQLSMLRDASHYLNRYGITSVVNATGSLAQIKLFAALRDRGELTVRTRTAFGSVAVPHRLTPQFLADLEEARSRYHDTWVSANLVKFFADGSTGLIPPLVYDHDEFRTLVVELDRRGYQLMTHAQRDDTVHMALDAYAAAAQANGPRDRRFRIEHDMVITESDLPRQAALSVIADMQPALCCSDLGTNYDPKTKIPSDRWHSLESAGVVLAFSSDWPCIWPPNPFLNIQEATTREIWHSDDTANVVGEPLDGAAQAGARRTGKIYSPDERITVERAVDAYTSGSAYAAFMDDRVGSLEAGKEADLAVLSQNLFSVPHAEIERTTVLMTMVGGKTVYEDWHHSNPGVSIGHSSGGH